MTVALADASRVLGIHPTANGYAYALFASPFKPVSWATHRFEGNKHDKSLRKIARLLDMRMPETVVLERFDGPRSLRSPRIRCLCRAIVALCENRGIEVALYDREHVASTFRNAGARSRDEIAAAVALHVDVLRPKLPRPRRPWECEDRRLAIFAAAALVLTHYRLDADFMLRNLA
jgi:hypothetical protein